ncbi:MAG: iron-containing alcohol dehydrogenase [Thiomicrospira sp.]|uniref:iron-containing alcohol dehydrogenase n=1 Tax=Thiomicrospira sp. TaxID=935 RepID=UPI0019FCC872|nr:iron-containing alcohol dehydrogenase [Thiomicrospira sp.]MBE0494080.1 iron-containing alcohol dehydrogenase [Thiomicrospira sp.]
MIPAFQFAQMPAIQFGWGVTDKLADAVLAQTKASLMLISGGYADQHFVEPRLAKVLEQRRVHRVVVQGEPSADMIDQLVTQAPQDIELVIGLGGGSVLDAAKAVAGLLPERFSVVDYLEGVGCGRKLEADPLPFIAVPTTAGTGSETTKNAVISRLGEFKKSFRDDRLVANQAWLDAAFLPFCPDQVLYATAMDAFTQLLESYTTLKANPMTDALAWQGMELFSGAFELIDSESQTDKQAGYERLMLAASLSGMTLANAGLGAVHGLAGPIGAFFKSPHGLVCAKLLAPVTRANIEALLASDAEHAPQTLAKYTEVAQLLTGIPDLAGLVMALENMVAQRLPQGLSAFGLRPDNLTEVLANCRSGSMLGNPLVLSDQALTQSMLEAL